MVLKGLDAFLRQVALLETNPYLLGVTIVVSIVHSVFEFLAFKNGRRKFSQWCCCFSPPSLAFS